MKWHVDWNAMSSPLIHRLLSLMQRQYKTAFLNIHIANPEMEFQDCFQWFVDQYGHCSEQDQINNKELMKREWNPQDEFEALLIQIMEGITYATFTRAPISDRDIVDIMVGVIMIWNACRGPYEMARASGNYKDMDRIPNLLESPTEDEKTHVDYIRPSRIRHECRRNGRRRSVRTTDV